MSLLTIVQEASRRLGLPVPTAVMGNNDDTAVQMLGLANMTGAALAQDPFTSLQTEYTWTTTATENQVTLSTAIPDFNYIVNQTIWNRSLRRPVFGALTQDDWQLLKSSSVQGPFQQYRIQGGIIKFIPAPAAGQTCAFEYISKYWATDSTGATGRSSFQIDTDLCKFDDELMVLGIMWSFKQAKGLDYTMEFQRYQTLHDLMLGRDGGKQVLDLDGRPKNLMPGIMVPQGSWQIP